MKFQFKVQMDYGKRGPIFYKTDEHYIELYGFAKGFGPTVFGKVTTRVNGPCTAYAIFSMRYYHFTNYSFGHDISKHFKGSHASHSARAWLNYMLNHSPCYCQAIRRRRKEAPHARVRECNSNVR
jgi:hypothetical protein